MSNAPGPLPVPILGLDLDVRLGDCVFSGGDLGLVAAQAYASQRFLLIARCNPGDLLFHPTFGAGLSDLIDEPYTEAVAQQVVTRMANAVAAEPYVQSVDEVDATMRDDGVLQITTYWTPTNGLGSITTVTTLGGQAVVTT